MSKVFIEETTLTSIGNAIRGKTGKTSLLSPSEMATEISAITTGGGGGIPEEGLLFSGNCDYRFAKGGWNWFINEYGNQIRTQDINSSKGMFRESGDLTNIPFSLNFYEGSTSAAEYMFTNCYNLQSVNINGMCFGNTQYMFNNCSRLREINFTNCTGATQWSNYKRDMFDGCCSLRSVPEEILSMMWDTNSSRSYVFAYQAFYNCYALDEIRGFPVQPANITSNMFSNTFYHCGRVKDVIFAPVPEGKTFTWKNQTIDLTTVGYNSSASEIYSYDAYSGITENGYVDSVDKLRELKDTNDWWTTNPAYSRYHKGSALATIASLPDVSGGSGNNIKFKATAGAYWNGTTFSTAGDLYIGTLTEEELAVAVAKGWTVSFVN